MNEPRIAILNTRDGAKQSEPPLCPVVGCTLTEAHDHCAVVVGAKAEGVE